MYRHLHYTRFRVEVSSAFRVLLASSFELIYRLDRSGQSRTARCAFPVLTTMASFAESFNKNGPKT